jgi:hypothetical protein
MADLQKQREEIVGDRPSMRRSGAVVGAKRPNRPMAAPPSRALLPGEQTAMAARLHIIHIPELDHLIALEYGRVDEGSPEDAWDVVGEPTAGGDGPAVGFLRDAGRDVGFKVVNASRLDVDAPAVRAIWRPPFFDVPMLGLTAATAGEIILAARALFGDRASISHDLFTRAAEASGEDALDLWLACLEASEPAAHYGVGTTLYDLGRYHEAYRHLRYYTEISPELSWTWCWYGRAAEALGLDGEARAAYRRALELEHRGGPETGADDLLDALEERCARKRHDRRRRGRRRGSR